MKRAVFTIIAKNYLAHARTLMESVQRTTPDVDRYVILVDEPEGFFDPAEEPFTVLLSSKLPIDSSRWFHFKYTILELSTAIKPYAAQMLLEQFGIDKLVYLDPDILCYQSLDPVFAELDTAGILLTPHLTAPVNDSCRPDEIDILRLGLFNLGFVAMRRCNATADMLAWWQSRLYETCVVSPAQGLFVDQRWMDLAPGLFPGVKIIRDPGWNAAYWNLHGRPILVSSGTPEAGGSPLLFFHFSGFDPLRPEFLSKHQNRFLTRDVGDAAILVGAYKDALLRNGLEECHHWPYTWAHFSDGGPIPDIVRPVAFESPNLLEEVEDPFSSEGKRAIASAWRVRASAPTGGPAPFSRLAWRVYGAHPRLHTSMPDVFGAHAQQFQDWFAGPGRSVHRLPGDFVEPNWQPTPEAMRETWGPPWLRILMANVPGLAARLQADDRTLRPPTPKALANIERLLVEPREAAGWRVPPEQVLHSIFSARTDLQARVANGNVDEGWSRAWMLTYGRREYRLPSSATAALEDSWRRFLAVAPSFERLRARLYRTALELSARRSATPAPDDLLTVREAPSGHPAALRSPFPAPPPPRTRPQGVNLVGRLQVASGIGEASRLSRAALEAAGAPVYLRDISDKPKAVDYDLPAIERGEPPYLFDLIHANADHFPGVVESALGPFHHPEFTIGYWFWELEEFPEEYDHSFKYCAEVWVSTEFCRRAIGARAPTPVVAIPLPIRTAIDAQDGRDCFSFDPDRFIFLCMADMFSVPTRKNPLGAIHAFLRAAPSMPGAELVVKINNAQGSPAAMDVMREAASHGPVRILDETMTRSRVDSLIACADCMVSLHRSEGFGLVLAEAMAVGKPAIATAYSGNMDFMDENSAFLVDYDLGCVPPGCGPYRPGAIWAEPSIDHAAARMIEVFSDQAKRASVAQAGRRRVRRQLDPAAVGRRMMERLEILRQRRAGH